MTTRERRGVAGVCCQRSLVKTGREWLWIAAVSFLLVAAGEPRQLLAEVPEQFQVRGGRAKEHPYLAETAPAPVSLKEVDASAAEAARGFILFSRPGFAGLSPEVVFGPADRCTVLEARDCPGQYGCLTFALLALRQAEFALKVTDLVSGEGAVIGADNMEVRAVGWVNVAGKDGAEAVPLLLETFERETVQADHVQQFWITYYIPEDARPGTYEGQMRITVGGEEKLTLPLRLRVNTFRLAGLGSR